MGRGKDLQEATAVQIRAEMAAQQPPMTRQQLAAKIGIAHNSVGRYLSGERDIPFTVIVDTAEALGLTVDELLKRAYARIGIVAGAENVNEGQA